METTDILEHHGIKGMKWGVRNDNGHQGEQAKTKKIAKLDKKFEKNMNSAQTIIAIHNRACDIGNPKLAAINNKPQYKGKDFTRDSPLRQKYYKEVQNSFLDGVVQAAKEMGTNASGTKEYSIVETKSGGWDIYLADVKHSDTPEFSFDVDYDDMGYVINVMPANDHLITHSNTVEDFLAHYGVKGQKWGVRRYGPKSRRQSQASRDHAQNRKLASMSDQELQQHVNRIRLERQYKDLEKSKIKKGHDTARTILAVGATVNAAIAFSKSPAGKIIANSLRKEKALLPLRSESSLKVKNTWMK